MSDISEKIKVKMIDQLTADPAVVALVHPSSIFPMQVGADMVKPFLRYGPPSVRPYEDWCGVGATIETTIHCFTVGESAAHRTAAAVESALSRMTNVVGYDWVRTQFRQDPDEASVWDGMVTVVVTDRA